jgi:hypothetical protein
VGVTNPQHVKDVVGGVTLKLKLKNFLLAIFDGRFASANELILEILWNTIVPHFEDGIGLYLNCEMLEKLAH